MHWTAAVEVSHSADRPASEYIAGHAAGFEERLSGAYGEFIDVAGVHAVGVGPLRYGPGLMQVVIVLNAAGIVIDAPEVFVIHAQRQSAGGALFQTELER